MKKYKILALFGKSAVGKDTIANWIVSNNADTMHQIVPYTTRPPRSTEIEGKDYYFISDKEFSEKYKNGEFFEHTEFNNWRYGTPYSSLEPNKINVGVFNLASIHTLRSDCRVDVLPIYIKAFDKIRLLRSLDRESNVNCHEICRRFLADEKDFGEGVFSFEHATYDNSVAFDGYFGGLLWLPKVKEFIEDKSD